MQVPTAVSRDKIQQGLLPAAAVFAAPIKDGLQQCGEGDGRHAQVSPVIRLSYNKFKSLKVFGCVFLKGGGFLPDFRVTDVAPQGTHSVALVVL